MQLQDFSIPIALLVAKAILKIIVGKSPNSADFVSGTLALPVDIVFLAISLLAAHSIMIPNHDLKLWIAIIIFGFALAAMIIFLSRLADNLFSKKKYILTILLFAVNALLSVGALMYSVGQLVGEA